MDMHRAIRFTRRIQLSAPAILLAAAAAMAQAGPPVSSPGVGEKGAETTETTSKAVPVKRPEEEGPASATNPEPMP